MRGNLEYPGKITFSQDTSVHPLRLEESKIKERIDQSIARVQTLLENIYLPLNSIEKSLDNIESFILETHIVSAIFFSLNSLITNLEKNISEAEIPMDQEDIEDTLNEIRQIVGYIKTTDSQVILEELIVKVQKRAVFLNQFRVTYPVERLSLAIETRRQLLLMKEHH